jgi:hypothetical protein
MVLARNSEARIDVPTQTWRDFVRAKCQWRLIHESVVSQAVGGFDQDKQLGPLRISKRFSGQPAVVAKLLERLDQDWQGALRSILPVTVFTSAIRGLNSPYRRYMSPDALSARRMAGYVDPAQKNPWGAFDDLI